MQVVTIDELLRQKQYIEIKSAEYIAAMRGIFQADTDADIVFGPLTRKDIEQLLLGIEHLIIQQNMLFDSFGQLHSLGLVSLKWATSAEFQTDEQKIESLVSLINNMLVFLPKEWQHYFTEKYKRQLNAKG